jgi:GDPmannose 4,6-dehydratase
MPKRALIAGITGQDGSYLAEFLLARGYEVHGLVRRIALHDPERHLSRVAHLRDQIVLHAGALEGSASLRQVVERACPDECYHLAAHSFVSSSFEDDLPTLGSDINATHCLLATLNERAPTCRFYFAGTSEMFGNADESPQRETSRFLPRSTYGINKLAGYHLIRNYRERFGLHASTGILYNHESPRRGHEFVTRRIATGVAQILAGRQDRLALGNLDASRDWGHACDYVRAMWLMLQQETPDDYVVATGESHSVREFAQLAFSVAGLEYRDHVFVDPELCRRSEDKPLVGDPRKAREKLGWRHTVNFAELVREMVTAECDALGATVPRTSQTIPQLRLARTSTTD